MKALSGSHLTLHSPERESCYFMPELLPTTSKVVPLPQFSQPPTLPGPQLSDLSSPNVTFLTAAACSPLTVFIGPPLSSNSLLCLIVGILHSPFPHSPSLSLSPFLSLTHTSIQSYFLLFPKDFILVNQITTYYKSPPPDPVSTSIPFSSQPSPFCVKCCPS